MSTYGNWEHEPDRPRTALQLLESIHEDDPHGILKKDFELGSKTMDEAKRLFAALYERIEAETDYILEELELPVPSRVESKLQFFAYYQKLRAARTPVVGRVTFLIVVVALAALAVACLAACSTDPVKAGGSSARNASWLGQGLALAVGTITAAIAIRAMWRRGDRSDGDSCLPVLTPAHKEGLRHLRQVVLPSVLLAAAGPRN